MEIERPLRLHALPFPGRDNASADLSRSERQLGSYQPDAEHAGSSSAVRLCHPQDNGLEGFPADGKAGLRMKEVEYGIGDSFMHRPYSVAGESRAKMHVSGTYVGAAPAPPSVKSKLIDFASQPEFSR